MAFIEKPILSLFALCDQILVDPWTQKHSLIGLFESIFSTNTPLMHSGACLFLNMTDGRGKGIVQVRLMSPEGKPLASFEQELEVLNPMAMGSICIKADLSLPHYGVYTLEVRADGSLIGTKTFSVRRPPEREKPATPPPLPDTDAG